MKLSFWIADRNLTNRDRRVPLFLLFRWLKRREYKLIRQNVKAGVVWQQKRVFQVSAFRSAAKLSLATVVDEGEEA